LQLIGRTLEKISPVMTSATDSTVFSSFFIAKR